jgi:hypothetical protein
MDVNQPFDSGTHLVAHLIRELESSLRAALEPYKSREGALHKSDLSKLCEVCRAPFTAENHKNDIRSLLKGLELQDDHPIALAWLSVAGTIHGRAHRDNLAAPRPMNEEFREFWNQITDVLFVVLDKLESRYLDSLPYLDALLATKEPTKKDAKMLQLYAPNNPITYGYFFDHNDNPAWLRPLLGRRIFDHPQDPVNEVGEDGTRTTFPWWPQSRYLARMAGSENPEVQQTVLEIALTIETKNISIHCDLADIAIRLPADGAVKLSEKLQTLIGNENPLFHTFAEKLGCLLAYLAKCGEMVAALSLSRSVFAVLPSPRVAEEQDAAWRLHEDPVSRMEAWNYQRILAVALPGLVKADGVQTIGMLCDLLETALDLYCDRVASEETDDYSDTWCKDINHVDLQDDVKSLLVSAVRKAVEQVASADPSQVATLVGILESRRWLIFKRMALHLIRFSPTHVASLITSHLMNRSTFDERGLWEEYIALAGEQFNNLSQQQQEQILGWIDEWPTPDLVKEQREKWDGVLLSDEEADRSVKARKLARLQPLRNALPDDWGTLYDDWTKELADARDREPGMSLPIVSTSIGTHSLESLRSMGVDELVANLSKWGQSARHSIELEPEGVGRELASLIASEPKRFAESAARFRDLDPIYLWSFLSGILSATKQSNVFPWRPVLTLCNWVIQTPKTSGRETQSPDQDRDWHGVRAIIAELVPAGLQEGATEIPFGLRKLVWRLLSLFTGDPQPTPKDDEQSSADPFALAINSARGRAMDNVMRYALWTQRKIKQGPDSEARLVRGFDEMPEVRKVLDHHLNPSNDPSPAIRAVYGQWLPNLVLLDATWVKQNLKRIFPADENSRRLLNAAWGTYIRYSGAYNNIFDVLRDEYGCAIDRIGEENGVTGYHPHSLDQRLAQHLMLLYARGRVELNDADDLLARFYSKAPDALCGHALWHVGHSFHESKEAPPEVLSRFEALWQKRLDVARGDPASHLKEMTAFGYLFYSRQFEDSWVIGELRNALTISKYSQPDYFVVQRLAALAYLYPKTAIECLGLLMEGVKGDRAGWAIGAWGMDMRTIIAAAMISIDDLARQKATEMIHRLGAQNHLEFHDLLPIEVRKS